VIVLDASGVPDLFSGVRTRLRGLLEAYARVPDAPPLVVRLARSSTLLEGVKLGAIAIDEVDGAGGPAVRALATFRSKAPTGALARDVRVWHSETIPPLAPRGVPALLTLHDLRWHEPHEKTGGRWFGWALRHAAARLWLPRVARRIAGVVTVSHVSARLIVARLRVAADRVAVVANAVDATVAIPSETVQRALALSLALEPRNYFVAVGRLETRKGLEIAIDALAAAPDGSLLAKAKLVLIGEGPLRGDLVRRATARGVAPRLVMAGRRDDGAVAALIAQSAALLFPSHVEGFGFPVHEALARGVPALASDLPCLSELAALAPRGLRLIARDANGSTAPMEWTSEMERTLAGAKLPAPRAALPAELPTWDDAARALVAVYTRVAKRGGAVN